MEIHKHKVNPPNVWHNDNGCTPPRTLEKSFKFTKQIEISYMGNVPR
jgi:hypothetical protein